MQRSPTRRQVLRSTAVAGLVAIAGCSASGADDSPTATSTATSTATATPTATAHTPPASADAWLADANGYREEVPRFGPGSQPTIAVGHPVDGGLSFDPPAIEVAPMTNVTWDWTGHGGAHNVVALDGTFDSGRPNAQAGTAYHYIFEEPGAYPFVSEPHRGEGMRGVVFVREPPSTGNPAVDEWVVDSSNFDGSVADETGADTATVAVGAAGNRGHFAFDPPVLRVSTGTRVVWEWTGNGGSHTVRFQDIDVDSGAPMSESGATFEHTFQTPGTYRYACAPHRSLGMKGAVVVE